MALKKRNETVKAQQTVCAIIAAIFVVNVFQTIRILLTMSAFTGGPVWYSWYGFMQLAPLIVCAALWIVARGSLWERAYQASVLSASVLFVGVTFSTAFFSFISRFFYEYFTITDTSFMYTYDFLAMLVPQLIATVVYVVMLRHQKSVKKVLALSKAILAFTAALYFVVSMVDTVVQAAVQYPSNQNLSSFVGSFIWLAGILLLTSVLFFLERRRGTKKPVEAALFIGTFVIWATYTATYLISSIPGIWTTRWLSAFLVACGCIVGLFAFRWLYRTLRVLE